MKWYRLSNAGQILASSIVVEQDDGEFTHDNWPCKKEDILAMIEGGELCEMSEREVEAFKVVFGR